MQQCQAQAQSEGEAAKPRLDRQSPAVPHLAEDQALGPADSGLSDATQAPNWLQRWAALLMPAESEDQSQASMQQWMSNITAAMQQAQKEGVQLPQAQEVLAGLMSLASVQSPAVTAAADVPNKGVRSSRQDSLRMPSKQPEPRNLTTPVSQASAARPGEKRSQPALLEGEARKVARTSQTTPRGETLPAHGSSGQQNPWYRAPILIQQRSNPEPGEMSGFPAKPAESQRPSARSQFRVYSNAFQEPLPSQRWMTGKLAREPPREDVRTKPSSENRSARSHHMIVTGASVPPRSKEPDAIDREGLRRVGKWGATGPHQSGTPPSHAPLKALPTPPQGSLHPKKERSAGHEAQGALHMPPEYSIRNPLGPDRHGPTAGIQFPPFRGESGNVGLEGQMAAAAWMRQRALTNPMLMQEGSLNPFAAQDANAFVNALSKMPVQAAQQLQGESALLLNLHLQQLAQSRGASTGVMPWQLPLPLSQSVPPSSYPIQEQWKEAMIIQAAKSSHAAGPARVYYQQTWPGDKDSMTLRRPILKGKESTSVPREGKATLKQPVARRPLPEQQRVSPARQSPGQTLDARSHLEQMVFSSTGSGRGLHLRPVADLPTDRSWSTPVADISELTPDMTRAPSMDSSLTGPTTIDVNNPFEVHREQMALDLSPTKASATAFTKASLPRPTSQAGAASARMPAFQPVAPPSVVVRQYGGSQSPPPRKSEARSSSSPSPQKHTGSKLEDEQIAAQTLLSLFMPPSQERATPSENVGPEGSVMRRPRSHRPKTRR